jgi:hypothetical protein
MVQSGAEVRQAVVVRGAKPMTQNPYQRSQESVLEKSRGFAEKRKFPRFPFIADAEIVESSADARFVVRISEIGRQGCYVDILNPVPVGFNIWVKIFKHGGTFESQGRVVYTHPTMGMGIVFTEMRPDQQKVLEDWILGLGG